MFDISFNCSSDPGTRVCRGTIQIDAFEEAFESGIGYWTMDDYRTQWIDGIRRVVIEGANSCLVTSITDPISANFIFWWPLYVDGTQVRFQNHVLFLSECETPFDENVPYLSLPSRVSTSDDGRSISEWTLPVSDLARWLSVATGG